MRRISIVVSLAALLSVAALASLLSGRSASAADEFDGLKCYKAGVQASDPGGQTRYIEDQFEAKLFKISKAVDYCSLANKVLGTTGGVAGLTLPPNESDLVCYGIKQAPGQTPFERQLIGSADQFNKLELDVTKPLMLCEPAEKLSTTHPAGSVVGQPTLLDFAFTCYSVRRHEGSNEDLNRPYLEVFDQFYPGGGKDVRLGRPVIFCAQVEQKGLNAGATAGSGHAAGPDGGSVSHLVCYSLSLAGPRSTVVETKDQIGFNKLRIGRQDLYCTPAEKLAIKQ